MEPSISADARAALVRGVAMGERKKREKRGALVPLGLPPTVPVSRASSEGFGLSVAVGRPQVLAGGWAKVSPQ